ncbi:tetraspanin-1-like isoform X1 [Myxocyprinus asiaticus]|uniref:tetraspanin-1-like isoform X1 n=1 Tax=Myxocyprinus asiaticus TaxID=70543 RepID=UPI00222198C8|nr:tetraspanin-1-like isoform X1 [Myxocyprinus asiaticus]
MGCYTFVKVMMVVFNLLIFLGGLCLTVTGIWETVDGGSFIQILIPFSSYYLHHPNVAIFCIVIGLVMILLGMLGCCGAQKESKCLLITFFSIILVICIGEVGAAVVGLVYTSQVGESSVYCRCNGIISGAVVVTESILRAWAVPGLQEQYGKDQVFTDLWNSTMATLQCCGFTNYTDFSDSYYLEQNGALFPPMCCLDTEIFPCDEDFALFSDVVGCFKQIVTVVQRNANIVGGMAAGVTAIELAAMGVSIYLYCYLDNNAT